jgi:hypothetical protein
MRFGVPPQKPIVTLAAMVLPLDFVRIWLAIETVWG